MPENFSVAVAALCESTLLIYEGYAKTLCTMKALVVLSYCPQDFVLWGTILNSIVFLVLSV